MCQSIFAVFFGLAARFGRPLEAGIEERRSFDQPLLCVIRTPPRPGIGSDSPSHQSLNVFPCRNLSVQADLQ
jgi:hypothetical protein